MTLGSRDIDFKWREILAPPEPQTSNTSSSKVTAPYLYSTTGAQVRTQGREGPSHSVRPHIGALTALGSVFSHPNIERQHNIITTGLQLSTEYRRASVFDTFHALNPGGIGKVVDVSLIFNPESQLPLPQTHNPLHASYVDQIVNSIGKGAKTGVGIARKTPVQLGSHKWAPGFATEAASSMDGVEKYNVIAKYGRGEKAQRLPEVRILGFQPGGLAQQIVEKHGSNFRTFEEAHNATYGHHEIVKSPIKVVADLAGTVIRENSKGKITPLHNSIVVNEGLHTRQLAETPITWGSVESRTSEEIRTSFQFPAMSAYRSPHSPVIQEIGPVTWDSVGSYR